MRRAQYRCCMSVVVCVLCLLVLLPASIQAAMNDYCNVPAFVSDVVPPMVMLDVGRDHKLYYQAYNDASDLDGDGRLDINYNHSIDYYGYFVPTKCYTYDSGAGQFNPQYTSATKFCDGSAGHWSGNVLNWLTMTRMDVLRKVLYGGKRSTDASTTVLTRAFTPMDAHSWGKELTGSLCYNGTDYKNSCSTYLDCDSGYSCVNKSMALIGMAGPTLPTSCTATAVSGTTPGMLVARYDHSNSKNCGVSNSQGMINSYEPGNLFRFDYLDGFDANPGGGVPVLVKSNIKENFNILVVTSFTADVSGNWQFAVDGDDDVEVQVGDTPVAQDLGCHGFRGNDPTTNTNIVTGSINLTAGTSYTIVARHFEKTGDEGIQVWFKKPAGSWLIVNRTNLPTLNSPTVAQSNSCALKTITFVKTGTPGSGTVLSSTTSNQHLFCNTTLDPNSDNGATAPPLLRLLSNMSNRIWDWSAKERPVCDNSLGVPTDYTVRVKVCDAASGVEDKCKTYGSNSKPTGLLQKYGEGDGTKVCSKVYSKTCTTDDDCGASEGVCIFKAPIYFGMMTGSYTNNLSGGVLRKNVSSILDEVKQTDGTLQIAASGNIIHTFDTMKLVGYRYSDFSYQDTSNGVGSCGWITDNALTEGHCQNWGNPIGEMMYETLRYFAGKHVPTTEFNYDTSGGTYPPSSYTPPNDTSLALPLPIWGLQKTGTNPARLKPYEAFPICSQPFMLVLSDINTSYDSDQIPGSSFKKPDGTSFSEDTALPILGLGTGSPSLLNTLTDSIGTTENIPNQKWFIGQSNNVFDTMCTAKPAGSGPAPLSLMRGLCPEEPTKRGSYYSAAVAYYGKTLFAGKTGLSKNVTTYAVALASPVADMKFKVGDNDVTFAPLGKSVSGALYSACYSKCGTTLDATDGLSIGSCTTNNGYCPTNQIVNFFADDIRYNASNDVIYARFRVNFEDVEQGADHDMDAIISYEVCTPAAVNLYGSCATALGTNQLQIKVSSDYAAGGIDQVLGFTISGTTADKPYLVVRDRDITGQCRYTADDSAVPGPVSCKLQTDCVSGTQVCAHDGDTPNDVINLPLAWSKIFTVSSTPAAQFLKNPLWYAAKWGGFTDTNSNNIPDSSSTDVSEWAKNCTETDKTKCDPDNYFLVVNPLKLETQLDNALKSILNKVSSGTASSILNSSEGSGANLLQAVFYPEKDFGGTNNKANWIGEMFNLWYYIDPFFALSTIRIDNGNYSLDLKDDYIATFRFDAGASQTVVDLVSDDNGDGTHYTAQGTYNSDDVHIKSLWRAGELLWKRNVIDAAPTGDPRNIYTVKTAGSALTLLSANKADPTVISLLQAADSTEAGNLIDYVHGIDNTSYRPRNVTITGCGLGTCNRVWKLGDIVDSTPKVESNIKLNSYDLYPPTAYGDSTYGQFAASNNYKKRGMVYVGANDGMLHAFKLGLLDVSHQTKTHKATILNLDGSAIDAVNNDLGREEWAFVPRNALPYLKYLADKNYSHLFYVDNTSVLIDASINAPSDNNGVSFPNCTSTTYWNCGKKTATSSGNLDMGKTSWRTILVGGMGLGGATKNLYASDGVTPDATCTDKYSTGTCVKTPIDNVGYSSYFALEVTNPHNLPGSTDGVNLLWEFNGDPANGDYLGHTTTGPAIVRVGEKNKNGRWFAVFANGPSGPIDTTTHSYYGKSDQNLKIFIVDLANGTLVKTIDTGVKNAFAGSLSTAVIDTDRWNAASSSFYSDDAIYIGYVKKDTTLGTWTKGGVVRLLTKGSITPDTVPWAFSTVIDDIGPVTTSVTKLQDRKGLYDKSKATAATGKLWLYFGTGRYYYKGDTLTDTNRVYGIQEPCYSSNTGSPDFTPVGPVNAFDTSGTTTTCNTAVSVSDLQDQSGSTATSPSTSLPLTKVGWYLTLDSSTLNDGYSSERVITNPVASPAGAIFFTTFRPTADICRFGGNAYVWAMKYDTGAAPPSAAMQGTVLMQVSTGGVEAIPLSSAFSHLGDHRINMRRSNAIPGMPPGGSGLALITNPKPTKKIMHYMEK